MPLIACGILRTQLVDIDLRIRWTIKQSTVAAAVVAIVYCLSEGAGRLLSAKVGNVAGLVAAALVVFFLVPLPRLAERVAAVAMPNTVNTPEYAAHRKMLVYEAAKRSRSNRMIDPGTVAGAATGHGRFSDCHVAVQPER